MQIRPVANLQRESVEKLKRLNENKVIHLVSDFNLVFQLILGTKSGQYIEENIELHNHCGS